MFSFVDALSRSVVVVNTYWFVTEKVMPLPVGDTTSTASDEDEAGLGLAVPTGPVTCLGFEGKLIKRPCGQAFLFASLQPGWERTILWFESRDMSIPYVKEMIRSLQFDKVYRFKDVIDFTPFLKTSKSIHYI